LLLIATICSCFILKYNAMGMDDDSYHGCGYDSDDDKGRCTSRGPALQLRRPTSYMLPEGVPFPRESGILEIKGGCKKLILELMSNNSLQGMTAITDASTLNLSCVVTAGRAEIRGFSIATPLTEQVTRLDWLFVHREFRRGEIGRTLWSKLIEQFPDTDLVGKIVDDTDAMKKLAKQVGAEQTEGNQWVIRRSNQ
jgi:hypothetical protein